MKKIYIMDDIASDLHTEQSEQDQIIAQCIIGEFD